MVSMSICNSRKNCCHSYKFNIRFLRLYDFLLSYQMLILRGFETPTHDKDNWSNRWWYYDWEYFDFSWNIALRTAISMNYWQIDKCLSRNVLQPDPQWNNFIVQSVRNNVIQITSKAGFMTVATFSITLTAYCYLIITCIKSQHIYLLLMVTRYKHNIKLLYTLIKRTNGGA
jgi:hypothetical protein